MSEGISNADFNFNINIKNNEGLISAMSAGMQILEPILTAAEVAKSLLVS